MPHSKGFEPSYSWQMEEASSFLLELTHLAELVLAFNLAKLKLAVPNYLLNLHWQTQVAVNQLAALIKHHCSAQHYSSTPAHLKFVVSAEDCRCYRLHFLFNYSDLKLQPGSPLVLFGLLLGPRPLSTSVLLPWQCFAGESATVSAFGASFPAS